VCSFDAEHVWEIGNSIINNTNVKESLRWVIMGGHMNFRLLLAMTISLLSTSVYALPCEAPFTCININAKCDYKVEYLTRTNYEAWLDARPKGAEHDVLWASGSYVLISYPLSCTTIVECRDWKNQVCESCG
jgi:hypothetical protein